MWSRARWRAVPVSPSLSRTLNMTLSQSWVSLFLCKQLLLLLRSCGPERMSVIWFQLSNQMVSFPLTHHWITQPGFFFFFSLAIYYTFFFFQNAELSNAEARQSKEGESEYSWNSRHTFSPCQGVWLRALQPTSSRQWEHGTGEEESPWEFWASKDKWNQCRERERKEDTCKKFMKMTRSLCLEVWKRREDWKRKEGAKWSFSSIKTVQGKRRPTGFAPLRFIFTSAPSAL